MCCSHTPVIERERSRKNEQREEDERRNERESKLPTNEASKAKEKIVERRGNEMDTMHERDKRKRKERVRMKE